MPKNKGLRFAFLTAIVSGVAIFINKFAVGAITPPLAFTAIKNSLVAVLVISVLITLRRFKTFTRLSKSQWLKLFAIGIIGGALPFYLFFTGLSQIPAVNAAIIHKSLVLWVAILAWPLLKEKLSPIQILAIILLFGSNIIIGGFNGFTWSAGEWMVLAATILWAVENVIAKRLLGEPHPNPSPNRRGASPSPLRRRIQDEVISASEIHPDHIVAARMGFGSLILLAATLWQHPGSLAQVLTLNSIQWLWMLATAGTLFAYVSLWYRALKFAPATTVTAVLVSSTLITNLLSAIFITHTWNTTMLIQGGAVVLGLLLFIFHTKKYATHISINTVAKAKSL